MSLAPAVLAVLPALKPPRPAPVADTSSSSGGVSTPAPRCRVPAPTPPLGGSRPHRLHRHDAGLAEPAR